QSQALNQPTMRLHQFKTPLVIVLCVVTAMPGCTKHKPFVADVIDKQPGTNLDIQQASYQQVEPLDSLVSALPPFDLDSDSASINYWDLSLQEAIQFALANSTVMREIGAN